LPQFGEVILEAVDGGLVLPGLLLPLRLDGLKGAAQVYCPLLHLTPVQGQGTAWGWRKREKERDRETLTCRHDKFF
jgi:hypothetical protein